MKDDELAFFVILFTFVIGVVITGNRAKYRRERLKVLGRLVDEGARLDLGLREQLLAELRRPDAFDRVGAALALWLPRLFFAAAWVLMFVGFAMVVVGLSVSRFHGTVTVPGTICAFVGFALVTAPLALRELDARRAASRSAD